MNEEKGNMNMTVGVVLTVAVAILLLVAMIPAMMPAQEGGDDGPAPYVTTFELPDNKTIILKDGDNTLATLNIAIDQEWSATASESKLYLSGPGGYVYFNYSDSQVQITDYMSLNYTAHSPQELSESPLFDTVSDYGPVFSSYSISPTAPSNTPDIYVLLWEGLFLNRGYELGFDPTDPPGGGSSDSGVDTNTVLIGAIITLMFISIALVAVRSFRARTI